MLEYTGAGEGLGSVEAYQSFSGCQRREDFVPLRSWIAISARPGGSRAVARSGTLEWVDRFVGLRVRHEIAPGR